MVTRDKKWLAGPPSLHDHVLSMQYSTMFSKVSQVPGIVQTLDK